MSTIVLKVSNAGVTWNDQDGLPWSATNLPADAFRFREQDVFYWEVEQQGFNASRGQLHVRVVDYWEAAAHFDEGLVPRQAVRSIVFAPLSEQSFKAQLSYYQQGALAPYWEGSTATVPNPAPAPAPLAQPAKKRTSSDRQVHPVQFKYALPELVFEDGYVSGTVALPGVGESLPFRIRNDHLLAEFNAIKPYFVKALKRQLIEVSAGLVFVNDEPKLLKARSPQIARIDEQMLQVFRARSIRQMLGEMARPDVDKSLFTPEEFFAGMAEDALGKACLPQDGAELLATLLQHRSVRNARQLTYLAGKLHQPEAPLRYVLSPKFGFVFLGKGQEGNHFILELLDSHATYVWSVPNTWKTLREQFASVEREIQMIATLGRVEYRRSLQFEHAFWLVVHQHAGSDVVDGFPRWKSRLEEGMF
ncbi:MAG: hypothetical protein AAF597_07180 [Bacteroidota bacterium]